MLNLGFGPIPCLAVSVTNLYIELRTSYQLTSQMTQRTRRHYLEVEFKAEAEVKIVVGS